MFKKNEVIKLKSKLFSSLSEKGMFWRIWGIFSWPLPCGWKSWWWNPELTENRWLSVNCNQHSKRFACDLPLSSYGCYAPKTSSLQTHLKKLCWFTVPTHLRFLKLYISFSVVVHFCMQVLQALLLVVVLKHYTVCMIVLDMDVYISQSKLYQ